MTSMVDFFPLTEDAIREAASPGGPPVPHQSPGRARIANTTSIMSSKGSDEPSLYRFILLLLIFYF
jgi:hypothetical protein